MILGQHEQSERQLDKQIVGQWVLAIFMVMSSLFCLFLFVLLTVTGYGQQPSVPDTAKTKLDLSEAEFVAVEKSATFPGGIGAFYRYLSDNMKMPRKAKRAGVRGRIYVDFVVNQDGTIDPASVSCPSRAELRKYPSLAIGDLIEDEDCKEEAVRLIKSSPAWAPASVKGKPVKQRLTVPVLFSNR